MAASTSLFMASRMRRGDWVILAAIIALHGLVFGLLWWLPSPQPEPLWRPALVAALIQPEVPAPVVIPPKPLPAKPRPVVQPTPTPPVLAAPEISPAPERVLVPAPVEEPPTPAPPEPAPIIAAPPAPVVEPVAVIPPRFDADYLDNPAPPYPLLSKRLREEGTVLVRVYVEVDGLPALVELKKSSGYRRLDDVALATVQQWRFVPARQGSAPVAGWVIVPISFSLRS